MFNLQIETDNAAFGDAEQGEAAFEIARILQALALNIREGGVETVSEWYLRDANGNTVGHAHYTGGD